MAHTFPPRCSTGGRCSACYSFCIATPLPVELFFHWSLTSRYYQPSKSGEKCAALCANKYKLGMTCINAFLSLFLSHNMRTHRSFSDNAVSFFKLRGFLFFPGNGTHAAIAKFWKHHEGKNKIKIKTQSTNCKPSLAYTIPIPPSCSPRLTRDTASLTVSTVQPSKLHTVWKALCSHHDRRLRSLCTRSWLSACRSISVPVHQHCYCQQISEPASACSG